MFFISISIQLEFKGSEPVVSAAFSLLKEDSITMPVGIIILFGSPVFRKQSSLLLDLKDLFSICYFAIITRCLWSGLNDQYQKMISITLVSVFSLLSIPFYSHPYVHE
jgi:hypothetical protein